MIEKSLLKKILLASKSFQPQELNRYDQEADLRNRELESYLIEQQLIAEEKIYSLLASFLNLPLIDLEITQINQQAFFMVPETIATTHSLVGFDLKDNTLKIAGSQEPSESIIDFLKRKTSFEVEFYLSTPSAIKRLYRNYQTANFNSGEKTSSINFAKTSTSESLLDEMLEFASAKDAKSLHIESKEAKIQVRYRDISGFKLLFELPKSQMSGLVDAIAKRSQTILRPTGEVTVGKVYSSYNGKRTRFNFSITPTVHGPKISLISVRKENEIITLENLGFSKDQLKNLQKFLNQQAGLVLLSGQSNSGITTTVYSLLKALNSPLKNIISIESPLEFLIDGVNQIEIDLNTINEITALQAVSYQDADVIMAGSITGKRHLDAVIACGAKGHLVIATLPAETSDQAIDYLYNQKISSLQLEALPLMLINQKLYRKICAECSEPYELDLEKIKELEQSLSINSLHHLLHNHKILSNKRRTPLTFYRGRGCADCNNLGHNGQVAAFEITVSNKNEQPPSIIGNKNKVTVDAIIKAKTGLVPLEALLE